MPRIGFTWSFPATIHKAQQIFKGHSGNYLLKSDSRADSILAATDIMPITRRKCCANSLLTETSLNFDQDAMLRFSLDQLSVFMGSVIHSHQCDQQITKYNNLLAMAACASDTSP